MTTEQFKILCRAYFPGCYFAERLTGHVYCYPFSLCRIVMEPYNDTLGGWLGDQADEFIAGKPEDVVKKVAEDMDRRYNENLGV